MKKTLVWLLALAMLFCLAACGGEKGGDGGKDAASGGAEESAAAKYGVDLAAAGEQKMSDERAAMDVLVETRDVWLEGKMTFVLAENPKTYADFVEHIGCDASSYTYVAEDSERHYVWIAEGNDTAMLLAAFWQTPDGWTLYSIGSTNLG